MQNKFRTMHQKMYIQGTISWCFVHIIFSKKVDLLSLLHKSILGCKVILNLESRYESIMTYTVYTLGTPRVDSVFYYYKGKNFERESMAEFSLNCQFISAWIFLNQLIGYEIWQNGRFRDFLSHCNKWTFHISIALNKKLTTYHILFKLFS